MNSIKYYLFIIILLIFASCELSTQIKQDYNDFFPINENLYWEYEITYSDADTKHDNFHYPIQFTTKVGDKIIIGETSYFQIENYFISMPSLGDTLRLIKNEDNLLAFFEGEDHLLYSFDEPESSWSLSMFVNIAMTNTHKIWAEKTNVSNEEVVIKWGMFENLERGELRWEEHFTKGIGRTKILRQDQVYGKTIWELTNTNVH